MKLNQVFETYDSRFTQGTFIYVSATSDYAFLDSAKTEKVDAKTLEKLFYDGVFVVDGTTKYIPVSYDITSGVGTLTCISNGGQAAGAVFIERMSSEYVDNQS